MGGGGPPKAGGGPPNDGGGPPNEGGAPNDGAGTPMPMPMPIDGAAPKPPGAAPMPSSMYWIVRLPQRRLSPLDSACICVRTSPTYTPFAEPRSSMMWRPSWK